MRFCMVTTFYPPYHFGGDAVYTYRLSNALARRGHQVDVIHDLDSFYLAHPNEPTSQFENHPNVTVYSLKSPAGFLSPLATQQTGQPLFKQKIKRLLESNHYDVIHFHNVSLIGPGAFEYGNSVKLQTLHEHWLLCPLHILWKFGREVCTHRQCFFCTLHGRRPPQLWRYTHFLEDHLKLIDQFISPSRFTHEKHAEMGLDLPMTVLPHFLPEYAEEKARAAAVQPRPYFLFAGRLVNIKGLQSLFPLFRNYPSADLVVAGEGDYGSTLQELARDLPQVKFVGMLPYKELRELYRNAIALIVPSICYEVFGMVLIESFSVKTPVIVRDLGGLPEVVSDSNGGFVYRTDADLVQAMARLQDDAALRRQLGENGYAAYARLWSEEPHLKKYFEIIQNVVERKVDRNGKQ